MRKLLYLVPLLILYASPTLAQEACTRDIEPVGGFSLCIPAGWTTETKEGLKFKVLLGAPNEKFTPNIGIAEDTSPTPLADFVTNSVNNILASYKSFGATSVKLESNETFKTASDVTGTKVVFTTEYQGILVRTLQFYFAAPDGRKLIITCSGLDQDKAALDPIYDRTIRTLVILKQVNGTP